MWESKSRDACGRGVPAELRAVGFAAAVLHESCGTLERAVSREPVDATDDGLEVERADDREGT